MSGRAFVKLSLEDLGRVLNLPNGVYVSDVFRQEKDKFSDTVTIMIWEDTLERSASLPNTQEYEDACWVDYRKLVSGKRGLETMP